jgi:hypothetical protein
MIPPVEMTNLFGNAVFSFQDELSSRPERREWRDLQFSLFRLLRSGFVEVSEIALPRVVVDERFWKFEIDQW